MINPVFIIACTLLVLLIMFGRNPIEEHREKLKKYGGDPLVAAIAEHNAQSGNKFNALGGVGSGGGTSTTPNLASGGAPNYPSYMMNGQNTYNNANPYKQPYYQTKNPYRQGGKPATAQPGQTNSYYPPPPLSGSAKPSMLQQPRAPGSALEPSELPMPLDLSPTTRAGSLSDGQKLGFAGTRVYTYNEEGKPVPLPDGTYSMNDGKSSMTIKNGKKILISN